MNQTLRLTILAILPFAFALTDTKIVQAQYYYGSVCPPGSVLAFRQVPGAFGVTNIPYCYYPRVYGYYSPYVSYYYGARPKQSYYYRGTTTYYRSPPPYYNPNQAKYWKRSRYR